MMKNFPIASVERESGLSKDTLRVWERRYGFPIPQRDAHGDRSYSPDQVEKLKIIRNLIDRGHRPAKLVTRPIAELAALLADNSETHEHPGSALTESVIELLRSSNHAGLLTFLNQRLATDGLMQFVIEHLVPINIAIGQAWAQGRISIAQEHLYTEAVQKILRAYLQNLRPGQGRPRVLLATLPGEQHGLGLLMVECVITAVGAMPISLGVEVPLEEVATAAQAHRCDAVALSFSRARTPAFVSQGVKMLRQRLDAGTELWIGGAGAQWLRGELDGVVHLPDLPAVHQRLTLWQSAA